MYSIVVILIGRIVLEETMEIISNTPLTFKFGDLGEGIAVTMCVSRKNRLSAVKEEVGDGHHLALGTFPSVVWGEVPGLTAIDLLSIFELERKYYPEQMLGMLRQLIPEYTDVELDQIGFQCVGHDENSAFRSDVHAHVVLAKRATWGADIIPRFTAPVTPTPIGKREPR